MISLKKVIVAAAVATLGFGLFAQYSKTNVATAGLFDTDVDNFVDVNEWSTVKPEKFFGYFGMDGNYNVGFAKQFEKFYWGTYYDGNIGRYNKYTNDDKTVNNTETQENGNVSFTNLFGFGNIGLRVDMSFVGTKSVTDNETAKTTKTTDSTSFYGSVTAGLNNYTLGKFNTKPYASVSFDTNAWAPKYNTLSASFTNGRGSKTEETHVDTVDTRVKSFGLGAGAEVTLSETETTKQIVNVGLGFTSYTPYDADLALKSTNFSVPVEYKVTYKASDSLALAFAAGAETEYETVANSKAKLDRSVFSFTPSVATGLTYDTKKKVILNAGVEFVVPSYTNTKNDWDGNVDETSNWNGSDCNLRWSSGFNWVPTKNISVDCSYEILDNLIGGSGSDTGSADMTTDLAEGNGTSIWNTLNQVLVHNIGFSVSVKF